MAEEKGRSNCRVTQSPSHSVPNRSLSQAPHHPLPLDSAGNQYGRIPRRQSKKKQRRKDIVDRPDQEIPGQPSPGTPEFQADPLPNKTMIEDYQPREAAQVDLDPISISRNPPLSLRCREIHPSAVNKSTACKMVYMR